jgi:hypothetical protein
MGFQRHATYGKCGLRFQITNEAASPCEVPGCGRDSVGTCQGPCGRRLCGLCGAPRGSFMCSDCIKLKAAEQQRDERRREKEEERRRNTEAREFAERQRAADDQLTRSSSPEEVRAVLERHLDLVSRDACETSWIRLMSSEVIRPDHEIATVVGRGHFLVCGLQDDPGWNWHERGEREDAWFARESGTYLDRRGWAWKPISGLCLGSPQPFLTGEKNWVALPSRMRYRTRIGLHYWGLVLLPKAPARRPAIGQHSLSRFMLPSRDYAVAMVEILCDGSGGNSTSA